MILVKHVHFTRNDRGRLVRYVPRFFKYMVTLLNEAIESERFSLTGMLDVTTKGLYESYTETMPPPKVEFTHDRDWEKIWKRLSNGVLDSISRNYLFLIIHERVGTKERAYRILGGRNDSPLCIRCNDPNSVENQVHRYCYCSWVSDLWCSLLDCLHSLNQLLIFESDNSLLHLYFEPLVREEPVLWLLGEYVSYIEHEVVLKNRKVSREDFFGHLLPDFKKANIKQYLR